MRQDGAVLQGCNATGGVVFEGFFVLSSDGRTHASRLGTPLTLALPADCGVAAAHDERAYFGCDDLRRPSVGKPLAAVFTLDRDAFPRQSNAPTLQQPKQSKSGIDRYSIPLWPGGGNGA